MNSDVIVTDLTCAHCQSHTPHQLEYAGRILISTTCLNCMTRIAHETGDLWRDYLRDLPHRVATKPVRLWRRLLRNPVTMLRSLPRSTFAKPRKMVQELKALLRNR